MTSLERTLIQRALIHHPLIRKRFSSPWRVKKLSDDNLLKLAAELQVNHQEIIRRINSARDAKTHQVPIDQERGATPDGAFTGVLNFTIKLEFLGHQVERKARVRWGYDPEWEYISSRGAPTISLKEQLTLVSEILGEFDGTHQMAFCSDGELRRVPLTQKWLPFDMLKEGVVPDAIVDEIEKLIDGEAREQNAIRQGSRKQHWN